MTRAAPAALTDTIHAALSRAADRLPGPVTADIDLDPARRPNGLPPLALVTCC